MPKDFSWPFMEMTMDFDLHPEFFCAEMIKFSRFEAYKVGAVSNRHKKLQFYFFR